MDYEVLLAKYIELVGRAEGVDYINSNSRDRFTPHLFSDEEWQALCQVRDNMP